MASRKGRQTDGTEGGNQRRSSKSQATQKREDLNRQRRERYARDEAHRTHIRAMQKQRYRETRAKTPYEDKLSEGLLTDGVQREVIFDGEDELYVYECYTLREAAEALGRSLLTIRSWIEKEFIPPPVCKGSRPTHQQYTRYELDAIAFVLSEHSKHSKYISSKDTPVIERLHDAVWSAREAHLGFELETA